MLFQEATPDTTYYLALGFAFLIGVPLLYIVSLILRRRSLERDEKLIESLKDEKK